MGDLLLDIQDQYNGGNLNIDEAVKKFKRLYKDNPKFQKSRIYRCIVDIQNKHNVSLEAIAEICESIHYKAELDSNKEGVEGEFIKWLDRMVDNINLEIARKSYVDGIENKMQKMVQELDGETKRIENSLNDKNEQVKNLKEEMREMTKNHTVILGIFASIILTTVSGLVFTASVLNNVDKSSMYRLVFIVCLIALLVFNTLGYLFGFVNGFINGATEKNGIRKMSSFNKTMFFIIGLDALLWLVLEKNFFISLFPTFLCD